MNRERQRDRDIESANLREAGVMVGIEFREGARNALGEALPQLFPKRSVKLRSRLPTRITDQIVFLNHLDVYHTSLGSGPSPRGRVNGWKGGRHGRLVAAKQGEFM